MTLEYDKVKNQKNLRKHHVSIPELATIFNNPFIEPVMDIPDVKHSQREKRFWAYGWTSTGWYVMIWYCYRGKDTIRIIGVVKIICPRLATVDEVERHYER